MPGRFRALPGLRLSTLLALSLAVAVLTSCAPLRTQQLGGPVSREFAAQLMQEWQSSSAKVFSLQGLARVEVQSPGNSMQGNQVILAEKPSRLRTETLSLFGSPQLTLAADGERFGALVPSRNVFYTGAATPENLGQFIRIPMQLADLVSVLLYQPPTIAAWKEEAFELQGGGWLLLRYGTQQRQELFFNQARQLVGVEYFDRNSLFMKLGYAEFSGQNGSFPTRFSLEVPATDSTISLEFSELETNPEIRPELFRLTAPAGASVVQMGK